MTRETKIGLLVGLAFIVVFAMLLSHSGPTSPPGDPLQIAKVSDTPRFPESPPQPAVSAPTTLPGPAAEPRTPPPIQPSAGASDPNALPNPSALEPPTPAPAVAAVAPSPRPPEPPGPSGEVLEMQRTAPPLTDAVPAPHPSEAHSTPAKTPEPSDPPAPLPAVAPAPPREYVVRKGETLGQIAKTLYGTASVRVVDFLIKANKDHIKNKHMVTEGQKLIVPQLPPDMFEPVTNLSVAHVDAAKVAKMEELINRRAPAATKTVVSPDGMVSTEKVSNEKSDKSGNEKSSAEKSPDKVTPEKSSPEKLLGADPPKAVVRTYERERIYEVQSKETFSSIAREQLGSTAMWKDIAKLNKGVDPTKMKPGTKIKLPPRRAEGPQSRCSAIGVPATEAPTTARSAV